MLSALSPKWGTAEAASSCAVGNVTQYVDTVNGTWTFSYDTLNRLAAADTGANAASGYASQNLCYAYDSFGNRTSANRQSAACPSQESSVPQTTFYNANNQVTGTTVNLAVNGFVYDAAGNVTYDGANYYAYDPEGRVCAVQPYPSTNGSVAFDYLYDAEGRRVAKGMITPSLNPLSQPLSCDPATNGFQLTETYVLDQSGEESSQLHTQNGVTTWERTNAYGAGRLLATYDANGLHFHLSDPLGTRRVQTDSNGVAETECQSLPYGDQFSCFQANNAPQTADDATPLHFTAKERDTESGLDYFGARYYGSSMGRFMSPDKPVDQHPEDPQSWNLYTYVRNNPLSSIDQDGNYDCGQMTADQCTQFGNNLAAAQSQLAAAQKNGTITDAQFKQGSDALGAYGTLNDHNGVTVNVGATGGFPGTTTVSNDGTVSAANPTGQNIQVTFNPGAFGGNSDALYGTIGHEGSHVEDGEAWAKAGFTDAANPTHFDTEFKAYGVTSIFGAAQGAGILRGTKPGDTTPHLIWEKGFPDVVNNALRTNMIKTLYPNWAEKAFQANTNPEKK